MAELKQGLNYSYYDATSGTRYLAHTCTDRDEEDRVCGTGLRFTIMEGGDHTQCEKKVLGAPVMGRGRG
jgi:hypothetical protein